MTRAHLTAEHAHILIEALAMLEVAIGDEHIDHETEVVDDCSDCTIRRNRLDVVQTADDLVRGLARKSGINLGHTPPSIDTANYAY